MISDHKKLDLNTLKGSFSLTVGPMKIEGWTFHQKNGKCWVNPPSKEYIDKKDGTKKFFPMVRFPEKDRYWKFQEWAVEQVKDTFLSEPQAPAAGQERGKDAIPF